MASRGAPSESSGVPFKWEEAPGRPIAVEKSPCDHETIALTPTLSLELPPKLQFPARQTPLFLHQRALESSRLHQSSPLPLQRRHSRSPDHHGVEDLHKDALKTAPRNQPFDLPHTWSSFTCVVSDTKHNELNINEKFLLHKPSPRQYKYSVSMDSWKAHLPDHEQYEQLDMLVSSKPVSFLAVEENEAASHASSPLQPIICHERDGSASRRQPTTIKASKESGRDDDSDDEGLHDFLSQDSSSLEKPSESTDESVESSYPPPSLWFLDFSPREQAIQEQNGGSRLVVRLVTIVKLKQIISSKVCKLKKRRDVAIQQPNQTSMWSPTLATYLFNEQKEERETRRPSLKDHPVSEEDAEDDNELPSSSNTLQVNPVHQLPSSTLRDHLTSNDDSSESEGSSSFWRHQLQLDASPCLSEEEVEVEEEEPLELPRRLSLGEQLAEFGDEYLVQFVPSNQSTAPEIIDSQREEPNPGKRMCVVRRTVKVLAATIKLILAQTEVGKRKGRRSSLMYGHCLKPTLSTISPVPSTHK